MGEHGDADEDNPLQLTFWEKGGGIALNMKHFAYRRTPAEMTRLVELFRPLPGTADALQRAVDLDYRAFCTFDPQRTLVDDSALPAFERALDLASRRGSATPEAA